VVVLIQVHIIHVYTHSALSMTGLDTVLKEFNEAIEQSRENSADTANNAAAVASGESKWLEREAIQQGLQPRTGAILLAVCRGKVSEGIDFSDGKL
jgi:Rad3-related DNA helicase